MSAPVNEKLQLARNFVLQTNRNVFLTGKAGTGKTTFLHQIKKAAAKRLVVVAPTGVAAINAGGVTIHSFFQLPFGPLVPGATREARRFSREKVALLRTLDLLIIDEISMVRADVLDGIDEVLRRFRRRPEPFGGVQLLMIGDMQQLPPVIKDDEWSLLRPHYQTGYFFGSRALLETPYISIELTHIYRQADQHFIDILNGIRQKTVTPAQLQELNQRHIASFRPADDEPFITLSTHNASAQQINSQHLRELPTPQLEFAASVEGDFPVHAYPTEANLELKVGAQVMFVKNDISREKRYFNGKIGRITAIEEDVIVVQCPQDDEDIAVTPVTWENLRYNLDAETKEIKTEIIGTFTQYPLKLAWAITIHKSQGLTFERAIIDASAAFAHGQVYVALSRCKTLEGIVLSSPIPAHSIKTELILDEFHQEVEASAPTESELLAAKRTFQETLIREAFAFGGVAYALNRANKIVQEAAGSLVGQPGPLMTTLRMTFGEKIASVAGRFQQSLAPYFEEDGLPEDNPRLQDRLQKASQYFRDVCWNELLEPLHTLPIESDNKQIRDALVEALQELEKELVIKLKSLDACLKGFGALTYLKTKNSAELDFRPSIGKASTDEAAPSGQLKGLYKLIVQWRDAMAAERDIPGYIVLPRRVIQALLEALPRTLKELESVKGFGKVKTRQLGPELLEIIQEWCDANGIQRTEPIVESDPEAPQKPTKSDTFRQTLSLFKEGKTIPDIASERGLTSQTIETHLARFVESGELSIYDLIARERVEHIQAHVEEHQPATLTEARSGLGEEYSYAEIRLVYSHIRSGN